MSERDEALRYLPVCEPCIAGEGSECHTPGCAFWLHDVPPDGCNEQLGLSHDDLTADAYERGVEEGLDNTWKLREFVAKREAQALERLAKVERLAESGIAAEARAVAEVEAERDALAATVQRVRALCDERDGDVPYRGWVSTTSLRAALAGEAGDG